MIVIWSHFPCDYLQAQSVWSLPAVCKGWTWAWGQPLVQTSLATAAATQRCSRCPETEWSPSWQSPVLADRLQGSTCFWGRETKWLKLKWGAAKIAQTAVLQHTGRIMQLGVDKEQSCVHLCMHDRRWWNKEFTSHFTACNSKRAHECSHITALWISAKLMKQW